MSKNIHSVYYNSTAYSSVIQLIEIQKIKQVVILCDTQTEKYCLPIFANKINFDFQLIVIETGEIHKNMITLQNVWSKLIDYQMDRNGLVINLGGGVVSDLGGFAASVYLRGVRFINFPTTLLAMVDAAIGGKTGIDFKGLKNNIGSITLPEMVGIDTEYLQTLPQRQILSGMAEVIKYGLISDKELLNHLLQSETLDYNEAIIKSSVAIKHSIVQQDLQEKGLRKTLNFGHTFGHALESHFLTKKANEQLLHGEAVAIGIIIALHLSHQKLNFDLKIVEEISNYLIRFFPKPELSHQDPLEIMRLMQFDKKNQNGKIQFVLLEKIGKPAWNQEVTPLEILNSIEFYHSIIGVDNQNSPSS